MAWAVGWEVLEAAAEAVEAAMVVAAAAQAAETAAQMEEGAAVGDAEAAVVVGVRVMVAVRADAGAAVTEEVSLEPVGASRAVVRWAAAAAARVAAARVAAAAAAARETGLALPSAI